MSGTSSFMQIPRILHPFAPGDRQIWFSGVTRGTRITVREGSRTTGETLAANPIVAVPVEEVSSPIEFTAELGDQLYRSDIVFPLADPSRPGPYADAKLHEVEYGEFRVPTHSTGDGQEGGFDAPLCGLVYFPAEVDGSIPDRVRHAPLAIIAHGHWLNSTVDSESYLGYAWLARHLARWGIVVCSISLDEMNRQTDQTNLAQQWSRAEVIYTMIECLLGDSDVAPFVDRERIGLVGHSMGGEAVIHAQVLNRERRLPYGIRGVVSIAPTNHDPAVSLVGADHLLLLGSLDYLIHTTGNPSSLPSIWDSFRLIERAWRPRTALWIDRAGHDAYNTVWFDDETFSRDNNDPRLLDPERQRQIGLGFITAFFADVLLGRDPYRGYLSGPMQPRGVGDTIVRRLYQPSTVELVDDSGDANEQFLLDAESPPDKTVNRRGEPVRAVGPGLDRWETVEHTSLDHSPHDTRSVDLAWLHEDLIYETGLGSLEVHPDGWLSLRVAQHYDENDGTPDETWNRIGDDIDLLVELDDGAHRPRVRTGLLDLVRYPLPACSVYSVFQTLRLPIDAFTAVEPELNIRNLQWLRLRPLTDRGRILLDDISFETPPVTAPSRITMLRAHTLGSGYGPRNDSLDGEVVVQLAGRPGESFGFPLRNNGELPQAGAMLGVLRSALSRRAPVRLSYRWTGPTVREIVRVIET